MTNRNPFLQQKPRTAKPIPEPLAPPARPLAAARRRVSVTLDQDRYIALRTAAATHRLSGDDIMVIALDRFLIRT